MHTVGPHAGPCPRLPLGPVASVLAGWPGVHGQLGLGHGLKSQSRLRSWCPWGRGPRPAFSPRSGSRGQAVGESSHCREGSLHPPCGGPGARPLTTARLPGLHPLPSPGLRPLVAQLCFCPGDGSLHLLTCPSPTCADCPSLRAPTRSVCTCLCARRHGNAVCSL